MLLNLLLTLSLYSLLLILRWLYLHQIFRTIVWSFIVHLLRVLHNSGSHRGRIDFLGIHKLILNGHELLNSKLYCDTIKSLFLFPKISGSDYRIFLIKLFMKPLNFILLAINLLLKSLNFLFLTLYWEPHLLTLLWQRCELILVVYPLSLALSAAYTSAFPVLEEAVLGHGQRPAHSHEGMFCNNFNVYKKVSALNHVASAMLILFSITFRAQVLIRTVGEASRELR